MDFFIFWAEQWMYLFYNDEGLFYLRIRILIIFINNKE